VGVVTDVGMFLDLLSKELTLSNELPLSTELPGKS
jgi:hypothetical protein